MAGWFGTKGGKQQHGPALRLPPLPPDDLDTTQRAFHDQSVAFIKAAFSGFQTQRDDGALLGPWTVWVRHPAIGEAAQALVAAIAALNALPKRVHEIVILAVGAHFDAAYELYAHCAVAQKAGLSDRQIAALVVGEKPDGLSDEEAIAFDCARVLARGGVLPGFLYAAAEKAFGEKGVAQLTYLAGTYAFVSMTLNAYDVPAPEVAAGGR
jgi:4-carboxymuconolactone decarboxylase